MQLFDFDGRHDIDEEAILLRRLRTVRRSEFGVFVLQTNDGGPSLWVHLNGELAYLHYFPGDEGHPGYQSMAMAPPHYPDAVTFRQLDGSEADAIEMPRGTICPIEAAYQAAVEFFRDSRMPPSVNWREL